MACALKISEAASLAMHAMGLLAMEPDRSRSVRAIAGRLGLSEAHLSKVLQRLVKAGLLRSNRGPRGGFRLTREPEQISLLEVFEAIEGPVEPTDCLLSLPLCDGSGCILGKILVDVNHLLLEYL